MKWTCFLLFVSSSLASLYNHYSAKLLLAKLNTPAWEYAGGVGDTTLLCSQTDFEAFDLLPPAGARFLSASSELADFPPTLSMQLRGSSWSNQTAYASLQWAPGVSDATKKWVNYFSFSARALPLIAGTTQGDVALPPLPSGTERLLVGFWYRPGPNGAGEQALLYTYGRFSATNTLLQGVTLKITEGATAQLEYGGSTEMPARIDLQACMQSSSLVGVLCKDTQWAIPDQTTSQLHGHWMHLMVGIDTLGEALLYLDGARTTARCALDLTSQPCLERTGGLQCSSYACATCGETTMATCSVPTCSGQTASVCTAPGSITAFDAQYYNRLSTADMNFPTTGNVFAGTNMVRFLAAPSYGRPGEFVGADGWYADPVTKKLPTDPTIFGVLDDWVTDIRRSKGTYAFMAHGSASMEASDKTTCATQGRDLSSADAPVGLSCFPTAPLSCVAVPHAGQVCGIDASTTFFEEACFGEADLSTCGEACAWDFDNDGQVTLADATSLSRLSSNRLSVDYPQRRTNVDGQGGFVPEVDAAWLRVAIGNLAPDVTSCNPHFANLTDGTIRASGHEASDQAVAVGELSPKTKCEIASPATGALFGADVLNSPSPCSTFDITASAEKLLDAVERAKYSFGETPPYCAAPTACGDLDASCTPKFMTTLTSDFVLQVSTRRALRFTSLAERAVVSMADPNSATSATSARRGLLRRQAQATGSGVSPPASPPSPPPAHPVLPSFEEWLEIISASFTGPIPAGLLLVVNGIVAVLSITLYEPAEELVDAFADVIRADSRTARALCAIGFERICA